MKTNRQMEAFYDEIREGKLDDPEALPQKLLILLNGGFMEREQCVFLSHLKREVPVNRLDFPDCTSFECFVNHIHVDEYLENGGLPPLEMLGRGIALARELKTRLAQVFRLKHFRIIVAFDGATCTVRFHTVRQDEEWVSKGGEEAVAVLDTREFD